MMVLRLAAYSRYIDIGLRLIGIVLVLWILNKEINPSYKLAWTMLILILPILGVVLYFVFGRSRIAAIMQQHFEQRIEESREYLRDRPQTRQKLEALDPSASNQSRYISDVSRFPVHENTTAEYFQVGDDMFPVLVRELKQAKKYIFIEYFIINDGVMWQTILNILEKKAIDRLKEYLPKDGFLRMSYDWYIKAMNPEIREVWSNYMKTIVETIYKINKPVTHKVRLARVE